MWIRPNKEHLYDGMTFNAEFKRGVITEGKITIEDNGWIFLCQDVKSGRGCEDKKGYKYSLCISAATSNKFFHTLVYRYKVKVFKYNRKERIEKLYEQI